MHGTDIDIKALGLIRWICWIRKQYTVKHAYNEVSGMGDFKRNGRL